MLPSTALVLSSPAQPSPLHQHHYLTARSERGKHATGCWIMLLIKSWGFLGHDFPLCELGLDGSTGWSKGLRPCPETPSAAPSSDAVQRQSNSPVVSLPREICNNAALSSPPLIVIQPHTTAPTGVPSPSTGFTPVLCSLSHTQSPSHGFEQCTTAFPLQSKHQINEVQFTTTALRHSRTLQPVSCKCHQIISQTTLPIHVN